MTVALSRFTCIIEFSFNSSIFCIPKLSKTVINEISIVLHSHNIYYFNDAKQIQEKLSKALSIDLFDICQYMNIFEPYNQKFYQFYSQYNKFSNYNWFSQEIIKVKQGKFRGVEFYDILSTCFMTRALYKILSLS
jgi:hypothetical protein